jgi:Transposase
VYDKFHVLQHANKAIDEGRRAEFFRKGGRMRGVVKGKRWLLLTRWMNLDNQKRQQLNQLFTLNRRVMRAYLLKESLERLWTYGYEGAELDRSTALATVEALSRSLGCCWTTWTGSSITATLRYASERGSHQRQHQNPSSKRPGLQESELSVAQGSAHGGHQDRIHRSPESSLKCGSLQILVQNRFTMHSFRLF